MDDQRVNGSELEEQPAAQLGRTASSKGGAPEPSAQAETAVRRQRREIITDLLISVAIFIVLLMFKVWLEHTTVGERMNRAFYDFLQYMLPFFAESQALPVIVDISNLPEQYLRKGEIIKATPRAELRQLIAEIANHSPQAIGVDIDFSYNPGDPDIEKGYAVPPYPYPFISPDDPQFFKFCLNLRDKAGYPIPVFLGVARSLGLPPEQWLGAEEFQSLAASIHLPKGEAKEAFRDTVYYLHKSHQEIKVFCPSMGAALANVYRRVRHDPPDWLKWAVVVISTEHPAQEFALETFLVDFTPLETLMKERITATTPDELRKAGPRLRNKIVLLGDATPGKARDTFVVPDRDEPVPGVYIHACAAYTLVEAPLYKLTPAGRIALDTLLALLVLGTVFGVRWYYSSSTGNRVDHHKVERRVTLRVLLFALIGGVFFVGYTRLMWEDFLLVALTLLIHPIGEEKLEQLMKKLHLRGGKHA